MIYDQDASFIYVRSRRNLFGYEKSGRIRLIIFDKMIATAFSCVLYQKYWKHENVQVHI